MNSSEGNSSRNALLALKREQTCMATNYDEFDSLSATSGSFTIRKKLAPARLRWRSRDVSCSAVKAKLLLWTSRGNVGSNEKEPLMKNGVSCLALGFGLLTETLFAFGQTSSPTFLAQGPSFEPQSGVLTTLPPAPVFVPPSGVLPTVERATTRPFKMAQKVRTAKRSTPVMMRRHVVHSRSASRRKTIPRTTTAAKSIAPTLSVVSIAAEQPGHDGIGYDYFLSQLGKVKAAK
jgi:hypothetical protein